MIKILAPLPRKFQKMKERPDRRLNCAKFQQLLKFKKKRKKAGKSAPNKVNLKILEKKKEELRG